VYLSVWSLPISSFSRSPPPPPLRGFPCARTVNPFSIFFGPLHDPFFVLHMSKPRYVFPLLLLKRPFFSNTASSCAAPFRPPPPPPPPPIHIFLCPPQGFARLLGGNGVFDAHPPPIFPDRFPGFPQTRPFFFPVVSLCFEPLSITVLPTPRRPISLLGMFSPPCLLHGKNIIVNSYSFPWLRFSYLLLYPTFLSRTQYPGLFIHRSDPQHGRLLPVYFNHSSLVGAKPPVVPHFGAFLICCLSFGLVVFQSFFPPSQRPESVIVTCGPTSQKMVAFPIAAAPTFPHRVNDLGSLLLSAHFPSFISHLLIRSLLTHGRWLTWSFVACQAQGTLWFSNLPMGIRFLKIRRPNPPFLFTAPPSNFFFSPSNIFNIRTTTPPVKIFRTFRIFFRGSQDLFSVWIFSPFPPSPPSIQPPCDLSSFSHDSKKTFVLRFLSVNPIPSSLFVVPVF